MTARRDIFVSHASADQAVALMLVSRLESHGTSCWIAPRDIEAGADYAESIIRAITEAGMFLLVFSANADRSPHVLRELDRAISAQKVILPVRIDNSKPSGGMEYRLCTVQWVDADNNPSLDGAVRDALSILDAVKKNQSAATASEELLGNLFGNDYELSLFMGAIHNADRDAEFVGDWDMRAVVNILSRLNSRRASVSLEPPVYSPEVIMQRIPPSHRDAMSAYIRELRGRLCGRSSVIVGAADRNPLAEVLLGDLWGIKEADLFRGDVSLEEYPEALIAYEATPEQAHRNAVYRHDSGRCFYRYVVRGSSPGYGYLGAWLPHGHMQLPIVTQNDENQSITQLGNIVIVENPYSSVGSEGGPKLETVIVLNGVHPFSAYALSSLLTGQLEESDRSVGLLAEVKDAIQMWMNARRTCRGIQFLVSFVMASQDIDAVGRKRNQTSDTRKLTDACIVPGSLRPILRQTFNKGNSPQMHARKQ